MPSFLLLSILVYSSSLLVSQQPEVGKASYYADHFEGRRTASGDIYKHSHRTAAHRTLPFGTLVEVTNLKNNKQVRVTINDRGPFVTGRVIDLSRSAANDLDFIREGIAEVAIVVIHHSDKNKVP